jgi:hypothetical protein
MKTKINYVLVLVLASFVFVGCASMHESKQWEYKTLQMVPLPGNDKTLNGYGFWFPLRHFEQIRKMVVSVNALTFSND